jgi:prolipoprotein diacylglyceryltransferase
MAHTGMPFSEFQPGFHFQAPAGGIVFQGGLNGGLMKIAIYFGEKLIPFLFHLCNKE